MRNLNFRLLWIGEGIPLPVDPFYLIALHRRVLSAPLFAWTWNNSGHEAQLRAVGVRVNKVPVDQEILARGIWEREEQ